MVCETDRQYEHVKEDEYIKICKTRKIDKNAAIISFCQITICKQNYKKGNILLFALANKIQFRTFLAYVPRCDIFFICRRDKGG